MTSNRTQQASQPPTVDALLDIGAVMAATSLSKASVYRMMKAGRFPKAKELLPGGRRVGWPKSQIDDWVLEPLLWGGPVDF